MDLQDVLPENRFTLIEEPFTDKVDLIETLFDRCIEGTVVVEHRESIWQTLLERERSMSTGIGLGVAIPHCSSEYVPDVFSYGAVLRQGVDFQAVDEIPVRIVILLLMPKKKFEKHIKILAAIARLFNDEKVRSQVLDAATAEEAYAVISRESQQRA